MHICADSSGSLSHDVMKKCLSPQFFNRAGSQTLIAGRKSREKERVCMGFCFFLESRNTIWVNQSILLQLLPMRTHARIQKVLSEVVQLCNSDNVFFFSFFRGERIQISLKSGHRRPASETPFKWHFAGVPMMAQR